MRLPTLVLDRLPTFLPDRLGAGESVAEPGPAAAASDRFAAGPDPSDMLAEFLAGAEIVDLAAHRAARRRGGRAWTI
jgi:hypothetical protein